MRCPAVGLFGLPVFSVRDKIQTGNTCNTRDGLAGGPHKRRFCCCPARLFCTSEYIRQEKRMEYPVVTGDGID